MGGLPAELRGVFEDGYTETDFLNAARQLKHSSGKTFICVWDAVDDGVYSGSSTIYILEDGVPMEMSPGLWEWLLGESLVDGGPGDVSSWAEEPAEGVSLLFPDGYGNYAYKSRQGGNW